MLEILLVSYLFRPSNFLFASISVHSVLSWVIFWSYCIILATCGVAGHSQTGTKVDIKATPFSPTTTAVKLLDQEHYCFILSPNVFNFSSILITGIAFARARCTGLSDNIVSVASPVSFMFQLLVNLMYTIIKHIDYWTRKVF